MSIYLVHQDKAEQRFSKLIVSNKNEAPFPLTYLLCSWVKLCQNVRVPLYLTSGTLNTAL